MKPHMLIVDDNPVYRASFCNLLELYAPDIQVVCAADGSAALRLTEQSAFDLIILDYQLPTISGGDVVRQLRARASSTGAKLPPIVLMSSQPDVAVFARALGATAFLNKPALAEDIQAKIVPLLARAEQPAESQGPRLWRIRPRAS